MSPRSSMPMPTESPKYARNCSTLKDVKGQCSDF